MDDGLIRVIIVGVVSFEGSLPNGGYVQSTEEPIIAHLLHKRGSDALQYN